MHSRAFRTLFALLIVFAFALPALAADAKWVEVTPGSPIDHSSVHLVDSDLTGTVFTVDVTGLHLERATNRHGESYVRLRLPQAGVNGIIGQPSLPVIRERVRVPFGADVDVEAIGGRTVTIRLADAGFDHLVWPQQPPVEKVPGARATALFEMDESAYRRETGSDLAVIEDEAVVRGMRYVTVAVSPVRYDPEAGVLRVTTDFQVRVTTPQAGPLRAFGIRENLATSRFRRMAETLFLNQSAVESKDLPAAPVGYLVITDNAWAANADLQDLLTHRAERGFDVTVATTESIGSTKEAIKAYIQDAYDNWDIPPAFLLLVGDTGVVPYWTGSGAGTPATDLNYAQLDGSDYIPDAYVGRISVADSTDMANAVAKTLAFENLDSPSTGWITTATFLASTDNYNVSEGTHNHVISTYLTPAGYTAYKRYTVTYDATAAQVTGDINGGLAQVTYSGHGATTYWADGPAYYQSNVNALTNSVYPYVQSYACITGQFQNSECFMETWLRAPHGAVAACGSSVNSYWDEDDIMERAVYEGFFDNPAGVDVTWLGGMLHYGKDALYDHYGNTSTVRRYFEMYNIMGDAAIDLWNAAPTAFYPAHDDVLPIGATTFSVDTGVADALAALSKDGGLIGAARADGSGGAVIEFDPIGESGDYKLVLTAHNKVPYEAMISTSTEVPYYCDGDGDGYLSDSASGTAAPGSIPYGCSDTPGTDCDDGAFGVNPGATEVCNGIDDNCDGTNDEGGVCEYDYYCDDDADGYLSATVSGGVQNPGDVPAGCQLSAGSDCDDGDTGVNPGADEVCNGIDDNCDGATDEGGAALCGDGNVCTDDACDSGLGRCLYVNNFDACDDGLYCTGGDYCQGGTCSQHTGDPCGTNEVCNESEDLCEEDTGICGMVSETGTAAAALLILVGMMLVGGAANRRRA